MSKRTPVPRYVIDAIAAHEYAQRSEQVARREYVQALSRWKAEFPGSEREYHVAVGTLASGFKMTLEIVLVSEGDE